MKQVLSVEAMRASDVYTMNHKTDAKTLMKRAGEQVFASSSVQGPVAIVCGTGNNAGDGYVIALLCKSQGVEVRLFLVEEKFSEDARYYVERCLEQGIPYEIMSENTSLKGYATVVDALLGIGFSGSLKEPYRRAIERVNASGARVISVDINSGLGADNGLGALAVRSDLTVAIHALKPGHLLGRAKDYINEIKVVDIGIETVGESYFLVDGLEAKRALPERRHYSHKGSYSYVGLLGGSLEYSGAIRLSQLSMAAMRSGAGVSIIALPRSMAQAIIPEILESTLYPLTDEDGSIRFVQEEMEELLSKVKVLAVGMGLGMSEEIKRLVSFTLETYQGTLIVDADALNALSEIGVDFLQKTQAKVILTPHLKEFSRLSGLSVSEIEEDSIGHAKEFASKNKVVLLLKGATSIVTDGEQVNLVDRGTPGMATAGSGDVLTGIITGLCGYNEDRLLAASAAAYINGLAGEIAAQEKNVISMLARDTAEAVTEAVSSILKE